MHYVIKPNAVVLFLISLCLGASVFLIGTPARAETTQDSTALRQKLEAQLEALKQQLSGIIAQKGAQQGCVAISADVQSGMSNTNVTEVQKFLRAQGYLTVAPTGYFGPLTVEAVKRFQSENGISQTGYVGSETRNRIQSVTCGASTASTPTATTPSYSIPNYTYTIPTFTVPSYNTPNYPIPTTPQAPASSAQDPGKGLWINGNNYVHDRGVLTDIYVPRCVPSQYDSCRYGSYSKYDSLLPGQVWSMRIPYRSTSESRTFPFLVWRSETGEELNTFDISVSTIPGDFSGTDKGCVILSGNRNDGRDTIHVYDPIAYQNLPFGVTGCPIKRNTMYYLNVRPAKGSLGETLCGSSEKNACRYRIVLPGVPSGFYY